MTPIRRCVSFDFLRQHGQATGLRPQIGNFRNNQGMRIVCCELATAPNMLVGISPVRGGLTLFTGLVELCGDASAAECTCLTVLDGITCYVDAALENTQKYLSGVL